MGWLGERNVACFLPTGRSLSDYLAVARLLSCDMELRALCRLSTGTISAPKFRINQKPLRHSKSSPSSKRSRAEIEKHPYNTSQQKCSQEPPSQRYTSPPSSSQKTLSSRTHLNETNTPGRRATPHPPQPPPLPPFHHPPKSLPLLRDSSSDRQSRRLRPRSPVHERHA